MYYFLQVNKIVMSYIIKLIENVVSGLCNFNTCSQYTNIASVHNYYYYEIWYKIIILLLYNRP